MRFLADTNILISAALFPNGKVAYVLSCILESHSLVIADYSISECRTVFERKFPEKIEVLNTFLSEIDFEEFPTPGNIDPETFPRIRDSKDIPILASAILSDVDILLSGDKDFKDVILSRPLIFTPSEYFDLLEN